MDYSSSVEKGDVLELKAFKIIKDMLEGDRLYVQGKTSKIFHKKGYFSKKRNANIIFDIAIETYINNSSDYSLLTLFECKNYDIKYGVGVADVEEFSHKISQVGEHNTK
jgi:hypothetical protein